MSEPLEVATAPERIRVLAMLHLPPPVHGVALKHQRMVEGRVGEAVRLRVIRYRFARDLGELGRPTARKALLAAAYGLRQAAALAGGDVDVGYLTLTTRGGGLLRDALYMHVFRRFGVPYVVHVPTLGLATEIGRLGPRRRRLVATAIRSAAAVVALNDVHRRELESLAPGRVVVIRNALPDVAPELVASGPRSPTILFLSNLYVEKGTLVLLDALPAILEAAPGARAVFAGSWPSPRDREAFEARVAELGLAGTVEVVGRVQGDAKLRLIHRAGVLVLPSYYDSECSPNVLIEAMRQGVPVVSTEHGGIPELIEDGSTGALVPARDPEATAMAVAAVLGSPEEADRMGHLARERYERDHRQERWDDQVIRLIEAVARGADPADVAIADSREANAQP